MLKSLVLKASGLGRRRRRGANQKATSSDPLTERMRICISEGLRPLLPTPFSSSRLPFGKLGASILALAPREHPASSSQPQDGHVGAQNPIWSALRASGRQSCAACTRRPVLVRTTSFRVSIDPSARSASAGGAGRRFAPLAAACGRVETLIELPLGPRVMRKTFVQYVIGGALHAEASQSMSYLEPNMQKLT